MQSEPVRVLVADADATIRKELSRHLEDAGYMVVPAARGSDIFLQCEFELPDILVIDAKLGDMEGYDACRELRDDPSTRDIPIIITAEARDDMTFAYLAQMVDFVGGDFFLAKPYDMHVLVRLISNTPSVSRGYAQVTQHGFPTRVVWPTSRLSPMAN